ncbi:MAG: hypothetical protein KGJ11_00905 [Candidatus Omnitrophica bacterium]|nr:hypothetical protein [Candidatus Omnitrophota bacterium]
MKHYFIKGAIRDGEHEYSKSIVCRRKGMTPRQANKAFLSYFSTGDYRIVTVDYFHEIPKQDYEVLKKYL